MDATLDISRQLFPFGFTCSYQASLPFKPHQLSSLADAVLRTLVPTEVHQGGLITDQKGREPVRVLLSDTPAAERPTDQELLYVAGSVYLLDDDSEQEEFRGNDFEVRIHTVFNEFTESNHITYRTEEKRQGALPSSVAVRDLGRVIPARVERFRFGLDLFQQKLLTSLIGAAPTVMETIAIDADTNSVRLAITAEGLKQKSDLPLRSGALFEKIDQVFRTVFEVSLIDDFKKRIS